VTPEGAAGRAGEGTGARAARPTLEVDLPAYTGPLDLLLALVRRNKVSIYDIPVATICEQYHEELARMRELDLDLAGEFLWMASWLLYLKSRMLLPRSREGGEDPRQELVERLVEYRRVKELADMLHGLDTVRRCVLPLAVPGPGGEEEDAIALERVDLYALARAYLEVLERFRDAHPPPLEVPPLRHRVEDAMAELHDRVWGEGVVPLLRHLRGLADGEAVVTSVVAVLELVRLGGVRASQRRAFGEIYLRPGARRLGREALRPAGALEGAGGR